MKEMKRILSLFLCLAMLVGYLPVGAMATENEGAQLETTAPVETVLLTADGENEETEKNTEPVVTDPAVTEPVDPKTVVPETTAPETTVPETTVPETTVPETTVPETTVPETTVPEETEPEETEPEETEPEEDAWTKYQEALKRYEELIAKLEASHKLAMEKEAAEKAAKKPSFFLEVAGGASDTAAAAVALADAAPIYILAGGDFQQAGDHAGSAENVRNILAQISQKYPTMDGMLFVGDYDCETHNSATETANGIAALMGAVQGSYSNLNDANSVLVQGNHDYMDSRIDATGGHEFDGYAAYVLNEDDYPNGGGSQSGIQTLANNLKTWLNNKIGEGYSAPIFIVSHLPLAYTPRTVTQGDAKYAKYIFDVLNDAGKNGLNIFFLHGHDHAYGPDNYMGGEAIYLPVGDKICIAEAGSTSKWTEETLAFTYMNAGYTGYYSDAFTYVTTAGTDKLTMTVFAITGSEVTVERYSEDGAYNLKSAGYDGSYSDTSVTNVSLGLPKYSAVYASPQTVTLTQSDASEMGTIGEWVGIEAETPDDDVKPSNKGWVEIIAPNPGTTTGGTTTYQYTQDTDGANADTGYLIVDSTNAVAMDNNSTSGTTTVNLTAGESGKMIANSRDYEWKIDANSQIYTTVNGTDYYLNASSDGVTLVTYNRYYDNRTDWTISNDNGQYSISTQIRTGGIMFNPTYTTYYLTEEGLSDTRGTVRLFTYEKDIVTGGTTTDDKNGIYAKVTDDLTYTATSGQSAEDALAALQAQVKAYYAEAMSAPGANETGTEVLVSAPPIEWTWVDTYNADEPGDYAVRITCDGKVLATAEVIVPATTTYYAAEGNGLYLVDMNTTEANAMAAVKAGVTVSSATDASGSNKTPISDDEVTWNWVDKYNGADSGPYTVEILKNGTSLGTVEVKVNIQYETGIETDWTYIGESAGSGGTTTVTYTLDTDGIDYGEAHKYIIVDDNEAIVLNANSASNGTAHSITISGNTATLNTRDYEYHMVKTSWYDSDQWATERYELITKGDGSQYLYQESNGVRYGTRSSVKFQVNHHGNGVYDIHDEDGTEWYIIYNGGWTVTETTSARVRLYKFTKEETTGGTPGGSIYALIEGPTVYTVTQGSSATKALAAVKAGITGYTATDANGTGKTELSDSDLTWKWKNTFNGNSTGSYWVEISYQGKALGTVEVKVEPGVVNNYPEYPDEGAVKVSKTGTGIDFQSSGIAQVEVSASGVPMKKGADVIVMLDTSSSMTTHTVTGTSKTRAEVLEESLKNMIAQFKTPGDDGQLLDIQVAIADFNGFYENDQTYTDENKHYQSGTPYDRDAADMMSDDISYDAISEAQIYTGDHTLGSGAFIPVEDLAASYSLNYDSGTNYDYAFDAIYQMATAKKAANTEDRDLYVIFMSDGAAMQWNYYHSQGASSLWNNWITGAWTADQLSLNCNTHAYYYDEVDHNGDGMRNEHRMANAIKGDPNETYEVIRKTNTLGTPTGETNMYMVPGLGATMFSISFDAKADTNVTEESMDKSIESLASAQTGTTKYYYKVTTAAELDKAFDAIGSEIAYAAYNARMVDQMGDDYNLQLLPAQYSVVDGTNTSTESLAPEIEIISYDIYTKADAGNIPNGKNIGDRKGTYTVLETITTNMVEVTAGTGSYEKVETKDKDGNVLTVNYKPVEKGNYNLEVYSDHINGGTTNILADGTKTGYVKGVIYAKTFIYNTNVQSVAVEGVSIPTGTKTDGTTTGSTNVLPSETFYWKMGTVQTSELAMRYYVYLTGSMEGTREAGSYPTNEFATLYYDNYLHNPCYKETVSPVMPWKEANVSYAFYLVDEDGNIIVNQTTGQTGSFANKIAVTNPVVYKTVLLNSGADVQAKIIADDDDVLPKYYTLYDTDAEYEIKVASNGTGSWTISKGDNVDVATTYVTQYKTDDASAYSNALSSSGGSVDYTHTIVWFAVKWEVGAHPDSVVVDYGLPVDISVLANDMFGENGKLAGVGAYSDSLNLDGHTDTNELPDTTYTGTYGTAKADTTTGKVRYTLKTMSMDSYEKFAYSVRYTGNENAGYYYDTVTVIPATTIYYEDSFLTFAGNNAGEATKDVISQSTDGETVPGQWYLEGKKADKTQDEDRPGKYSLTDANNIYGYDSVNNGMSMYSLGSAAKVHVDANSYATAEFSFSGTGFDVISMTSNTTGALAVKVTAGEEITMDNKTYKKGDTVKAHFVNTYYGYKLEAGDANKDGVVDEGEMIWVVNPEAKDSLYQVPVIQIENLPYAKYDVLITATYAVYMDKTSEDGYDLCLDAIRIYNPANDGVKDDDTTIQDAYKADGEAWPSYIELRNKLIDPNNDGILTDGTLGNDDTDTEIIGEVFIDGDGEVKDAQIEDYKNFGPNNEVYLANGQSVAFILGNVTTNVQSIHLGAKSANGNNVTYTIKNIARADNTEAGVKAGQVYNEKTNSLNTATDMYYDITGWRNNIIVITNTSESILSLTNIKATYKSNPNAAVVTSEGEGEDVIVTDLQGASSQEVYVYMTPAAATLTVRSLNNDLDEPETPDVTEPSQPEESVPEESIPETTEPDVTEPEETEPEETQPDKKADKIQKEIEKALKKAAEEAERMAKELQKAAAKAAKTLSKLFSKWF